MKKGWKIFWTVIISLTGAGVVFCIIALCLGVTFSQFEKAYPNGIGIMRKNYVSFDDDWDDDDELDDTENVVSEEAFSGVEPCPPDRTCSLLEDRSQVFPLRFSHF